MEEYNDPFGSIVKNCMPTPSQEDILNTCGFARESEVVLSPDSDADGIPVDSTGITMVSPPESPNNDGDSTEDSLHTPPEESLPVSPGVQRPPSAVVDGRSAPRLVPPANTPASTKTAESSKGSSNLGFSETNSGGGANRGHGGGIWQGALFKLLLSLNKSDDVSPESVRKEVGVSGEGIQPPGSNSAATNLKGNVIDECQMGGGLSEEVIDLEDEDEEEAGVEMGVADQVTDEIPVRETKPKLAEMGVADQVTDEIPVRETKPKLAEMGVADQVTDEIPVRESKPKLAEMGVADQVTDEIPVRETKPKLPLATRKCKEVVPEVCEEGNSRRSESCNRAISDGKTGPSVETQMDVDLPRKRSQKDVASVDLPVIENRPRLASGKCKEVPINTEEEEEDHAKKRSEIGDSVKRARLSQMDADLPSTETTKDVASHRGKKDCEIGDQGLARKERVNLDRLKQVISSNDRKSIPHFPENHQMDVDSPRKELQKDSDVDSLRKETQKDESLSNDKGLCDRDETKQGKSIVVSPKRALPPSVTGQGENAKRGVALSKPPPKFQNVEKLLDGLKRVVEKLGEGYDDDETDIDFFEMAKRRGMTFPRPRWWPPGGFN